MSGIPARGLALLAAVFVLVACGTTSSPIASGASVALTDAHDAVLTASMTADGMALEAEMYQDGVDDDGPPQQPRLKAGERLGISTFAVPACSTPTLGSSPVLTLTLIDETGTQLTRRLPVSDPKGQIATGARAWCGHGPLAALQSAEGTQACRFDRLVFLVRNPTRQAATLTLEGTDYTAPVTELAADGSVELHVTRTGSCTSSSKALATVAYADGTTTRLDLPFS